MSGGPDGLTVRFDATGLTVVEATHEIKAEDGRTTAAVWGFVDASGAQRLVDEIVRRGEPSLGAPQLPWAVIAHRPDGYLVATTSTTLPSGLFWAADDGVITVGTDPRSVICMRPVPTTLSDDFVRAHLLQVTNVADTPYTGVHRVAGGVTATWGTADDDPDLRAWIGPEVWPDAAEGVPNVLSEYLSAWDAVLSELLSVPGPVSLTMSGGLDSTFIGASLARLTGPERPIHALMHVPLPEAGLEPIAHWDPDDSEAARRVADAYPDRLSLTTLANHGMVTPLDAALASTARSWLLPGNSVNLPWLDDLARHASALGSRALVMGEQGNVSFSYSPPVPPSRPSTARRAVRAAKRVVRPTPRPSRIPRTRAELLAHWGVRGLQDAPTEDPPPARRTFLLRLARLRGSGPAVFHPRGLGGPMVIDPFAARSILDLAARFSDEQWLMHGLPRGLSRALGEGRVPDEVRLRQRRGGQAWDTWYVMSQQRQRYEAEVDLLPSTPGIADLVDIDRARRAVAALPWGERAGPGHVEIIALNALLGTAACARLLKDVLNATSSEDV